MMADLMADGPQVGFRDLMVAARPDTCGHAMEVPERTLNDGAALPGVPAVSLPIQAARMATPGAVTSGCKEQCAHCQLIVFCFS